MSDFSKKENTKMKTMLFITLLFVFISNVAVFGQTTDENNTVPVEKNDLLSNNSTINPAKQEVSSNPSNMNFVLWFMGSKQSPNALIAPDGSASKKQFMTSGTAPNRLLIKAFLKKAVNFESAIV